MAAASNTFVFVKDVSDVFDYSYDCDIICYALLFYVEYYVLCVGHSFNALLDTTASSSLTYISSVHILRTLSFFV